MMPRGSDQLLLPANPLFVWLSLLLAFMRDARAAGKGLVVRGLPQDMREIAKVSGLHELLEARA